MLKFKRKENATLLLVEQAIEDCAGKLLKLDSDSDEYAKSNEQFMKLVTMKAQLESSRKISPETWAMIIANLGGILLILNYERVNVVTTKAIGFISKPKI